MVTNNFHIVKIEDCLKDSKSMAYGILQPGANIENGIPMIRTVDIGLNGFSGTRIIKVSKELHQEYKRTALEGGEVLLSVMGTVGRTMVVPKSCIGWNVNRALAVMRLNENVDADYFSEYLKSPFINDRLVEQAIGSAQKRINLGDLRKYELNLPPLPEQRKIAKILSTWDKAITTTEKLIATSQQQKKALMQQLLTGKKRLINSETGMVFEGDWEEVRLGHISAMNSGGTPKSSIPEYYGGDIPWVSIADMTKFGKWISTTGKYLTESGISNSSARLYPKGTVLYAMYASIGECSIATVELSSSQAILGIRPSPKLINTYLYYYLCNIKERIILTGQQGTQSNLNAAMVKDFKIQLPSLQEQQKIASVLTAADKEIELLDAKLAHLKQEKKALMQQLLTGKKRVKLDNSEAA